MDQEPLPQIHLIRDTDLSVFAYELHIFAGDFLRECEFNMRSLATNTGADSIAIMGKNHMWLSDALFAYCSTADLHQMILTTEFIGEQSSHKTVFAKVPAMGQIWRDFGHAFSFASSSSRGIYPSPSYLIWMCCTRFPLDLSGAST